MIFHFIALSKIVLEHEPGESTSTLKQCDLKIETSKNLDRSKYIDGRCMPRKYAMKPIINALVHGLVVVIKWSVKNAWATEEEIRATINAELDRGLASEAALKEGVFKFSEEE